MSSKKLCASCLKLDGVPLPRPQMTEERRRECSLYQKEVMLIEKELELKRKEKELERLRAAYESQHFSSRGKLRENIEEMILNILNIVVNNIIDCAESLEEFKYIYNLVIRELEKELKKQGFLKNYVAPQRRSTSRNGDSTSHDVESLTLNQAHESASINNSSIPNSTCCRECDNTSVNFTNDISHHSEGSTRNLEYNDPSEECSSSSKIIPSNNVSVECQTVLDYEETQSSKTIESSPDLEVVDYKDQDAECENDGWKTPPKLIRSNSYTLESPSPSVLEYFRNLAVGGSSEMIVDKSSDMSQSCGSATRSAVRNLNNMWGDEDIKQASCITSPSSTEKLVHVDTLLLEHDINKSLTLESEKSFQSWLLENTETVKIKKIGEDHSPLQNIFHNIDKEKKVKAAITIQAAARGFLVRRLMKTHKVETIKNTIKDAVLCAWQLYRENAVTPADLHLHERIIQQVTAACYELHSIFFKWSTTEKMALIKSDRERLKNPKPKFRPSRSNSVSESSSSSRSTSRSRSSTLIRPTKSASSELKRPTTLPSISKTTKMNFETWRNVLSAGNSITLDRDAEDN